MKSRFGLVVLIGLVVVGAAGVGNLAMAADPVPAATSTSTGTGTGAAVSTPCPLPPPPDMNLKTEGALPANFRGGNPDSSLVHVLEDYPYKRDEHTILYQDDASALPGAGSGAKFEGPPIINWTTQRVNADGTTTMLSSENTNSATNQSEFPEPGEYKVGNGGARMTSGGSADASGAGANGAGSGAGANGAGSGAGATGSGAGATGAGSGAGAGATANGATGTGADTGNGTRGMVTSNQTMGVLAHDCTAPSLWGVIQEGGGKTECAKDENALKAEMAKQAEDLAAKILVAGGVKAACEKDMLNLSGDLKDASLLVLAEDPINAKPKDKTSRVVLQGAVYDKDGKKVKDATKTVAMRLLNEADQTRVSYLKADKLPGVFIRRNVPILMAAHQTDNGEYDKTGANCFVVTAKDNKAIEKTDNAYLFRRPNYPRAEYADEPDYEFVMQGSDKAGNRAEVRVPLFIVDTQASFETGQGR